MASRFRSATTMFAVRISRYSYGKPSPQFWLRQQGDIRRWVCYTAVLLRNYSDPKSINKKMIQLGGQGRWGEMLDLARDEQGIFNHINCSTLMNQLGKMDDSFDKTDARFVYFYEALVDLIVKRGLTWMQPWAIANVLHAVAKMKPMDPISQKSTQKLLQWISQPEIAAQFVKEGGPQNIANAAWSCAQLDWKAPALFLEMERGSKRLVKKMNPQDMSNVAWACAKTGFSAPNLLCAIIHRSKFLVDNGAPQAVSNTAWACGALCYDAPTLYSEIDRQSKRVVQEGNVQDISNVVWACGIQGYEAPNLFVEMESNLDSILKVCDPQDVAIICHAMAILDLCKVHGPTLLRLWEKAVQLFTDGAEFDYKALVQLAQTKMLSSADGIELPPVPRPMVSEMQSAFARQDQDVSDTSQAFSCLLAKIGFQHELEVSPNPVFADGMLAIDYACKEQRVAIECDGPHHFLKKLGSGELTRKENGVTKAKRRYLEKLGWKVINIDYRDYDQARQASNAEKWLRKLLKRSGVTLAK